MSAPITAEQLAAWRALCEAATPGPWRAGSVELDAVFCEHGCTLGPGVERNLLRMNRHFPHEADAAFIATARTAMPLLLAEVARLNADLEAAQQGMRRLCEEREAALAERDRARAEAERGEGE